MKTTLHRSDTRGHADHGWLESYHTFSFANYYSQERIHFGALRVLNDDRVAPGRGFGTHPHDNMEIISIPLEGDLEHKDSMGNTTVIREGDLQVMSAGTGIFHSEYNRNQDREVKFLQIWVFPNKKNVEPRYDQISLRDFEQKNVFFQVLSPHNEDQGVWIHQDAWFHLGNFDPGITTAYKLQKNGNGVYVFMLEGEADVAGSILGRRDGIGIADANEIPFNTISDTKFLIMEVPMTIYNN
jgi:redox-sensitive bicupin YhaK (pirin superfamily)